MIPALSRRQKAGLAVALALLLWAPMGVSHGDATLVTGHSTFYDGDVFSPCLASLAGIMRHRVMWFNDQVLVETYGGKGTFVYITETGAADPRIEPRLYTEGVFYDFVDPNGAHWRVEELFYDWTEDIGTGISDEETVPSASPHVVSEDRTYVWVVELAARPIFDEFAGGSPHTYYNFLSIVDTCKMHNNTRTYDGEEWHGAGQINDRNGHRNDDTEHGHGRFMVDIWVGKRPGTVLPLGASTDGAEWESDWAQSEAQSDNVAGTEQSGLPEDTADPGTPEAP